MLSESQKKAAESLKGPVLVLAGAGSGKTHTLTRRIINLIHSGVLPQNILALTFTNKAANEMKERIFSSIKNDKKISFPVLDRSFFPFISTFHSLGVFILKENYRELGISKYFSIYDRRDSEKVLKESMAELSIDPKENEPKKILNIIFKNKGKGLDVSSFKKIIEEEDNFFQNIVYKTWALYEKKKRDENSFDFEDLLLETVKLLSNKDIREHYRKKWTHINLDEYQDINTVQQKLVDLLAGEEKNIFAVGDPDQLIYSWRGSEIENIINFSKKYKESDTIFLEENYRSTKTIVEASNNIIQKNKERIPKKLFSNKEEGEKIVLYKSFSEKDEAFFIAEQISDLIEKKTNPNSIAVLYRANFLSRGLEEAFLKKGISYQVLGTKFFDRAEVKDCLSYLKLSLNRDSNTEFKRAISFPKRGFGKVSILKVMEKKQDELSGKAKETYKNFIDILDKIEIFSKENYPSETIKFILDISGIEKTLREKGTETDLERLGNLYELLNFATKYDNEEKAGVALEKFLEEIGLLSDTDTKNDSEKKPTVKLLTIHAAKGLEFDSVFVCGCEEDLFMSMVESDFSKKQEEERRLFYVATTRARKKLYLSWSTSRYMYGQRVENYLIDFVLDIPEKYLENIEGEDNSGYLGDFGEYDEIYID